MKLRRVAIVALGAVGVVLLAIGIRIAWMKDVPSDEFESYIINHAPTRLGERLVAASVRLPLLMEIRFPKAESRGLRGAIGFPDRTDVYGFESAEGLSECHVHIRRDRVCLVTFEGVQPAADFLEQLSDRFPGLTIK